MVVVVVDGGERVMSDGSEAVELWREGRFLRCLG